MKSLLLTLMAAAMPIMAQEAAPAPAPGPHPTPACPCQNPHFKHMLAKFDANKDGQLDDQEKAAMKAEFAERRGPRHRGHGPAMRSPRRGGCCGAPGPQGRRPAPQGCPCCAPPPAPDPAQD